MRILVSFLLLAVWGFTPITVEESTIVTTDDDRAMMSFTADKGHSTVGFKARHFGVATVNGSFGDYEAMIKFDPEDLSTLHVEATIQTASVDTGIERRDNHLRSDDFFNAEQFPTIKFVSKGVKEVDGDELKLVGDLTIRDVTKEVVLDVEYLGMTPARGAHKAGFEARTKIDRFDYNLKFDRLTEAGGLVVGKEVRIVLEMELNEVVS